MVGVEEMRHRPVLAEEVGEEPHRLAVHRLPQPGKLGEVAVALLVEGVEVGDVEPLAAELKREPVDLRVAEHPRHLASEHR